MPRVGGVQRIVPLQPDMAARHLCKSPSLRNLFSYLKWPLPCSQCNWQLKRCKQTLTLTMRPSPRCVLGATRTSSPSSPSTRLQTICFGFCRLLASTTSPKAQRLVSLSNLVCYALWNCNCHEQGHADNHTHTDVSKGGRDVLQQQDISSSVEGGQHAGSHALRTEDHQISLMTPKHAVHIENFEITLSSLTTDNSMQYSRTK